MNKGLIIKNVIKELVLCILNMRVFEGFYEKLIKNFLDDRFSLIFVVKFEFVKEMLREMFSDFEFGNVDMDKIIFVVLLVVFELLDGFCGEYKDMVERIVDIIIQLL